MQSRKRWANRTLAQTASVEFGKHMLWKRQLGQQIALTRLQQSAHACRATIRLPKALARPALTRPVRSSQQFSRVVRTEAIWGRSRRKENSRNSPSGESCADSLDTVQSSGETDPTEGQNDVAHGGDSDAAYEVAQPGEKSALAEDIDINEPLPLVVTLTIQEGDTLENLASSIGVDIKTLIEANGGKEEVDAGQKLHWQMPLPGNPQKLLETLGSTPGAETAALEGPSQSMPPPHPIFSTFRVLAPCVAVGTAALLLVSLLRFSAKLDSDEKAALRQRAERRRKDSQNGKTSQSLAGPEEQIDGAAAMTNRAGPALHQPTSPDELSRLLERQGSGKRASTSAPDQGVRQQAEEPDWIGLPMVFVLDLPGSQLASFRLQPQLPDEYSLVAFETKADAEALKGWFLEQHKDEDRKDFSVLNMFPLEFLKLAEQHEKGASFIARDAFKVGAGLSTEELWIEMIAAARSLPRRPLQKGLQSVQGVLQKHFGVLEETSHPSMAQDRSGADEHAPTLARADHASGPSNLGRKATSLNDAGDEGNRRRKAETARGVGRLDEEQQIEISKARDIKQSLTQPAMPGEEEDFQLIDVSLAEGAMPSPKTSDRDAPQYESSEVSLEEREGELLQAMESIQRQAQDSGTYVPNLVRQFAEGFSNREASLQAAKAGDSEINPLDASDSEEMAEIQAILTNTLSDMESKAKGRRQSQQNKAQDAATQSLQQRNGRTSTAQHAVPGSSKSGATQSKQRTPNGLTVENGKLSGSAAGGKAHSRLVRESEEQRTDSESFAGLLEWVDTVTRNFSKRQEAEAQSDRAEEQSTSDPLGLDSAVGPSEESAGQAGGLATPGARSAPSRDASEVPRESVTGQPSAAPTESQRSAGSPASYKAPVRDANGLVWESQGTGGLAKDARERQAKADEVEAKLRASFAASETAEGMCKAFESESSEPLTPPQRIRRDWWKQLPVIHLPAVEQDDGNMDYLILNMSMDKRVEDSHVIGFANSDDASKFQWLFRSLMGNCSVISVSPKELIEAGVGGEDVGMTVYKRNQLPLSPGLKSEELPELLAIYAQ